MDRSDEGRRCRWTSSATNLLVSIWCHDMVQSHLKSSPRNQPIWESIARYMTKKGFPVTGLQCRTRIKNMMGAYQESLRKNDPSGIVEPYYDIFRKVVGKRRRKKNRDVKLSKAKDHQLDMESIEMSEIGLTETDEPDSGEQVQSQNSDGECRAEVSGTTGTGESDQASDLSKDLREIANLVLKAIDMQTKEIINAINVQSQSMERLMVSERQKLELLLASERKNRSELETRLDRLLSRIDVPIVPQVTYMVHS